MTQEPTPRGPLGQLIEDAKLATGKQWRTVESESGIPLSSIQSWVSGRSGEPSLRGLLHLARYLKIPAEELVDRALDGYVPPLEARASDARSDPGAPAPTREESTSVASVRAKKREAGKRQPRRVRHPPSA